ncbi:RND transporter [Brevibacillus panacihumi W25]|uniref:RND transporter n=1 Tax=Brevibacillus panacihumi W25 TaxID=1408254 RepID=V6M8Y6_9BACL|nr:efflux RND transporter periplasmic adaptor subunit [Brevibacillus panacihumi]EST54727.1 RND transporter [Brevibacillus panacihumi W25]
MKKTAKTLGLLIAAVSLFAAGCSESSTSSAETFPAVKTWKVASVQTGLTANGKVVAAEEVQVVSKVSGKVATVPVQEGSVVKQGDTLVTLEASDFQEQINQAQAAIAGAEARLRDTKAGARTQQLQQLASTVEQAQATLKVAENNYTRMKALFDSGALSQAELERVTLDTEKARTGLEQAQAAYDLAKAGPTADSVAALEAEVARLRSSLDMAKNGYDNTIIHAPISGIVAKKNVNPGEMAGAGAPLLVLVKMDQVKVEASVPQAMINNVKVGSTVDVKVAGMAEKVWSGEVEFVSPVSDANSSSFPIKVRLDNQDGLLRAGMVAEVYLQGEAQKGTKVPASAVVEKENKNYIYTVDQGVVHQVEVSVSESGADWAVVASGVKENDQIVIHPTDELSDGSMVSAN